MTIQLLFTTLLLVSSAFFVALEQRNMSSSRTPVSSVTFLVSVNDTWDPKGCIATVKTPPLIPDRQYNETPSIVVGSCDRGPLVFSVTETNGMMTLFLTFYSSVILDASPPTCNIKWNGTYLVPQHPYNADQSLLPGCYTTESREGYHMTYYWFYIIDWTP